MTDIAYPRRRFGSSNLMVSPVAFGCWPIAGITSIVDSEEECIAAIEAALNNGVNFFDTAYSYGYQGESDRYLRIALSGKREQVVIASKVGFHWSAQRERVFDARPETLLRHAREILDRLDVPFVDVMYLHTPDGKTPIEKSAEAIARIVDNGWAKYAAVSNVNAEQAESFRRVCPVIAVQPPFNMLQQDVVAELRDWAKTHEVAIAAYWVLMKGLLAGHLNRDHRFDPRDRRLTYDIFQGEKWQRNQDFLDRLRAIAQRLQITVSQLVIAWTLAQPQLTVALCGAKHPAQAIDNAQGMLVQLDEVVLAEIDAAIKEYGAGE